MIIRVEGVPFDVHDAREFAWRTRRYHHPTAALGGAMCLADQLDECIWQCGGELLPLTNEEKVAASAALYEWRHSRGRPETVETLYLLLAPRPEAHDLPFRQGRSC